MWGGLPWEPLQRALLCAPKPWEASDLEWVERGYPRPRRGQQAIREHRIFRQILTEQGVDVLLMETPPAHVVDACYTCDPILFLPQGAVITRMGKESRRSETPYIRDQLLALQVPIVATLTAPATLEGGDCVWLSGDTLAVGIGHRSNMAGVEQLRTLLPSVEVLAIPLPVDGGPEACFHLGSILSMLGPDLALVYGPLLPSVLRNELETRAIATVECVPDEFDTQACNVLCTAPYRVVMAAGNPQTKARLESCDVTVTEVPGDELMVLGTGGPTCLVQSVLRG